VDQTTGWVAFTWYDARNDPNNVRAEVYGTVMDLTGAILTPNVQVAAGPSDAPAAGGAFNYGDYIGMDFNQKTFWVAWGDNSNSTGDNPDGQFHQMDVYAAPGTVDVAPAPGGIAPRALAEAGGATGAALTPAGQQAPAALDLPPLSGAVRLSALLPSDVLAALVGGRAEPQSTPDPILLLSSEASMPPSVVLRGDPASIETPKEGGGVQEQWLVPRGVRLPADGLWPDGAPSGDRTDEWTFIWYVL
jgi:hypothetical protein